MKYDPSEVGLIGGVEKREIQVVDYDPEWPNEFEKNARRIREALGDTARRVEHIGSTSVPGLAAKPTIDILVVVNDSADESVYLSQLMAAGYELRVREPDWNEHRMFRTQDRSVHVHLYSIGCREIERNLTFRDRLRRHDEDRRRYQDLKLKLATNDWSNMNA